MDLEKQNRIPMKPKVEHIMFFFTIFSFNCCLERSHLFLERGVSVIILKLSAPILNI